MRLQFEFSNGTPPVDFSSDQMMSSTPVELFVADQGSPHSRNKALNGYVRSLDFLFRGVSNYAVGDIFGVSVERGTFGRMGKQGHAVNWDFLIDKHFIVNYDISIHSIHEHMYFADAIAFSKKGDRTVTPVIIHELINPATKAGRVMLDHTREAVALVTEYIDDCSLVFTPDENLAVLNSNGKKISINDIGSDESYVIVQLLALLLGKGNHHGVFFIDARGFSDKGLSVFSEIAKSFFGDTFIFVYNCNPHHQFKRVKVTLPNYSVTGSRNSR